MTKMLEGSISFSTAPILLLLLPLVAGALVIWILHHRKKTEDASELPPLVRGLPFLGSVLGFDQRNPHHTLTTWAKTYGDVFRMRILGETMVVVSGKDLIRQALVTRSQDFAGRPRLFRVLYGFHYADDIIFGTFSGRWMALKKVASQALRSHGSGTERVEGIVREEMKNMVSELDSYGATDVNPTLILMTAVINAISAAVSITYYCLAYYHYYYTRRMSSCLGFTISSRSDPNFNTGISMQSPLPKHGAAFNRFVRAEP